MLYIQQHCDNFIIIKQKENSPIYEYIANYYMTIHSENGDSPTDKLFNS